MLTDVEKRKVIRNIRLCSILNPVLVDVERAELKRNLPRWKERFLQLSFALLVLNAVYKTLGLFYILLLEKGGTPVLEIVVHITLAEASTLVAFWYYLLFYRCPEVHVAVVKLTLGCSNPEDGSMMVTGSHKLSRWQRYTLQDLIALYAPHMVFSAALAVIACFLYAPTMKLLLYAAVPERFDGPILFALCMAEDIRCVVLVATTAMTVFPVQVLTFDGIKLSLSQLAKGGNARCNECSQEPPAQDLRILRKLQLYMAFVNEVHSYIIFTFKMYCISLCIANGYAAVAHFSDNPLFGVMYYVILFDCLCLYAVMYDKAFQIPRHFDQALKGIMLRQRPNSNDNVRRREYLEKQLRSIPRAGVKVGDFHTLERTSTPVFIHHVLKDIVNMLVGCI